MAPRPRLLWRICLFCSERCKCPVGQSSSRTYMSEPNAGSEWRAL
jgi:hypothetical protein